MEYDHIVIGGGVNGLSTAYQLAKRGKKTILIEKFPLPHSRGSSHGQSRGIRRAYPDPYLTSLMEQAYKEWDEIMKQTGVKLIKETGLLCFSDDPENKFLNQIIKSFEKNPGAKNEVYSGEELSKNYPYIRLGSKGVGCYDPSGGVLMADKALKCLQELIVRYGGVIHDGDGVEDIKHDKDKVHILTSSGKRFVAKSCVICAGPWSGPLLKKLGYTVPLQPIKIPVYYWKSDDFLPHTWIYEGYLNPGYGVHFWGLPSLEYPGLVKICPHHGPDIDPDTRDKPSTDDIKQELANFIRTMFPTVEPVVSVEESCIYTLSPDWNPILDTLPAARNIVIGVGFSGTGFKLGPVTGSILADLAMGIKDRQDVKIFSLDRFSTPKL